MKNQPSMTIFIAISLASVACLPVDTRPEPAKVIIDVDLHSDLSAAQVTPNIITFQTDDGWAITLDRLFVSMGYMMLDGKDCNYYEGPWYGRILDLSQPGPQRLAQIWGLGDCQMSYDVMVPADNAVLGAGVTEADRTFMANALVPVSTPTGLSTAEGMTLHVRGTATKDAMAVGFDWGFSDELNWNRCRRIIDGKLEPRLPLVSGETTSVTIGVDPRNLFRAAPLKDGAPSSTGSAQPLMQSIFGADQTQGIANGRVALDELEKVQLSIGASSKNLAEVMRLFAYPSIFVYGNVAGAQCNLNANGEEHGI